MHGLDLLVGALSIGICAISLLYGLSLGSIEVKEV